MPAAGSLAAVDHVVVLMPENRSFDHMLGFLYTGEGNVSPSGQPYEGLTGSESNFGSLSAAGVSWAVYGYDAEPLTRHSFPGISAAGPSHFGLFTDV